MIDLLLRILALADPLWRRLGAHPAHLQAILRAKLLADQRRPFFMGRQQSKSYSNIISYLLMTLFGLFLAAVLALFNHLPSGLAAYFLAWLVFMVMTLITDFTEVLIDVRDNYILHPRPVSDRTLTLARLLHILLYLGKLVFFLSLAALIYMLVWQGLLSFLLLLFIMLLGLFLTVALVSMVYLLLLRLARPERFREWISYFQIAFSVFIFGLYYLLPRLIDMQSLQELNLLADPLTLFLPSAWLAGLFAVLRYGEVAFPVLLQAGLGLTVPVLALYAAIRAAPRFAAQFMSLGLAGSGASGPAAVKGSAYRRLLARSLTRPGLERQAFQWSWAMMLRSRDFKVRTYPAFGFIPIFFVYLVTEEGTRSVEELGQSSMHLVLLYIAAYMMMVPLLGSRISERYRGAWIFRAHPLPGTGPLLYGLYTAVIGQFFIPVYTVLSLTVVWIWGPERWPDLLIALMVMLLLGALYVLFEKNIPFSQEVKKGQDSSNFAFGLILTFLVGGLGVLHYMSASRLWLQWPFGLGVTLLTVLAIIGVRRS